MTTGAKPQQAKPIARLSAVLAVSAIAAGGILGYAVGTSAGFRHGRRPGPVSVTRLLCSPSMKSRIMGMSQRQIIEILGQPCEGKTSSCWCYTDPARTHGCRLVLWWLMFEPEKKLVVRFNEEDQVEVVDCVRATDQRINGVGSSEPEDATGHGKDDCGQ